MGQSNTAGIGRLGRDELGKPFKIDANSYANSNLTECANARFRGSNASVCPYAWWTRVRSNDVQRPDTSGDVYWSF